MKIHPSIVIVILLWIPLSLAAQVKITDGSVLTMDPNSLLELESTSKGFLPPRVIINSLSSASPLTAPVPEGMLVYSSGGTVSDGYYIWDGTKWKPIATGVGGVDMIAKSADATLTKTETFIVANNSITLTLPSITSADNGLSISITNVGTFTDLIIIVPNSSSTIIGETDIKLTRWVGYTFIAYENNWIVKDYISHSDDLYDISETSSWKSIPEVLAFLNLHMTAPTVVRIGGENQILSSTQTINLPYPVTFEALSYSSTTISPTSGFTGGMFVCQTECYFKHLQFASTFGGSGGHDAIRLNGPGVYYEIKDCSFEGFNKGVVMTNNCDVWIFEDDFNDIVASGIEVASASVSSVTLKLAETDFTNCGTGINLLSGRDAVVSVQNCGFYLNSGGQAGLNYVPASFTLTRSLFFTNNYWNNGGSFITGFDFTRADGRDANLLLMNNAGIGDKNPRCKINVVNNVLTTNLALSSTWYKANWLNTSSFTVNWLINNNRFTYLPKNPTDIFILVSGNLSVNGNNRTVNIGIVKNGVSTTRYGETTLRIVAANQPFQYSTSIYIQNVALNDYFELYVNSSSSGDVVTFQDVNIFVDAR
jgi:hypothetical protein